MFERIAIIGRLGKDPELRHTKGNDPIPVTNFSVAVNWKDAQGNDQTKWFDVSAWRNLASPCAEYLSKGSLVYVEGTITARAYTSQNGTPQAALQINAHTVKFLQTDTQNNGFGGNYEDDNIPF